MERALSESQASAGNFFDFADDAGGGRFAGDKDLKEVDGQKEGQRLSRLFQDAECSSASSKD